MSKSIFVAVEVKQLGYSVGVGQRRVNIYVTVATARRKVFVFEFAEGNNLGDTLSMRPLDNVELVFLTQSENDQVTVTLTANQQLSVFSGDIHRRKRFVHFVGVCDSLREFVPQFERAVRWTGQKFVVSCPANSIDGISVRSFRLEVSLANEHIRVDFRVGLRLGLRCAVVVVALLVCFHFSLCNCVFVTICLCEAGWLYKSVWV